MRRCVFFAPITTLLYLFPTFILSLLAYIRTEFHGGSGFISNHVYLTNYFEKSLRLVDPRTSLHFMEYSRYFDSEEYWNGHLSNTADGGKWLFATTKDWFGSNDPNTGHIIDGRWAGMKVPRVSAAFYEAQGIDQAEPFWPQQRDKWMESMGEAHGYSPFGLQRSVHQNSPDEFILRFNNADRWELHIFHGFIDNKVILCLCFLNGRLGDVRESLTTIGYPYTGVTCDDYATFFHQASGLSTMDASYWMEYTTHGPIHLAFGGGGGDACAQSDAVLKERFGMTDFQLPYVCLNNEISYRKLWIA